MIKYRIIKDSENGDAKYIAQYYDECQWHDIEERTGSDEAFEELKELCHEHAAEHEPEVFWVEVL